MRVSGVDKAFGATFVDLEGLKYVASLAYRKGGSLYVYLEKSSEEVEDEVQNEIAEVLREMFGITGEDISLKEKHPNEYKYAVLNEKTVKKAFARLYRKFKRRERVRRMA